MNRFHDFDFRRTIHWDCIDPSETTRCLKRLPCIGWKSNRVIGLLIFLTLGSLGCRDTTTAPVSPPPEQDSVTLMRAAMQAKNWQLASDYSRDALITRPGDPDLLTDAARIAAFCDRKRDAAQLLIDAAASANYRPASRVDFAVQALIDVGELYRAIDLLENSLQVNPENDEQRRTLVGFLGEAQRMDRIPLHLKELIRRRKFDFNLLFTMTETSSRRFSDNTSKRLLQRNPSDHRVRMSEAFVLLYRRDAKEAAVVLRDILDHHPDFAPAHAMYGQALVAQHRWDDLPEWLASAPPRSRDHADYWLTLGDWSAENDRPDEATRAYWEATRREPNNNAAWDRLAQSIRSLRETDSPFADKISDQQLDTILQRSIDLLDLRERFNHFTASGRTSQRGASEVASSLAQLGRYWEAEAWSAAATTLQEEPAEDLGTLRQTIVAKLQQDSGWLSSDLEVLAIDLSGLPAPSDTSQWTRTNRAPIEPALASTDHLRLSEESASWGLAGIGGKNNPTDARLAAIIRSTGVGGGAIDYDLDGLPDLLMMNAGGTMLKRDSMPNDLMRNVGRQFSKVTAASGVGDTGYGQGVGIGDFNEDGFPDLFFANLGKNRLLRNNGDGTFADCSDQLADHDAEQWSTSAAFVDINADGLADLITTNYCKAVANLDRACPDERGNQGPCHPLKFAADEDQILAGTEDGQLQDVTAQWVTPAPPGRGLGIVAGSLDGSNLGLFIANDMSRNAYYSRDPSPPMALIESAAARGVAVDGRTLAQASMGIASSDFDRDGDLDLYVTGFGREYNVYYEQIAPGLWRDETSKLDLVQPTLSVVGFGSEAIDLDNDGIDEIIVTNGHIGQFDDVDSLPYAQPLQIFRRGTDGRFLMLEDDDWGEYFATPHVGRALWTVDVNRDGRNDLMVTHMYEPICLMVNRGDDQNDRIGFKLVARKDSRDAVGAVVRFECQGAQRTLWSLAGDGYLCSNERVLRAGLGEARLGGADQVENVTVTWQDGSVDHIGSLDINAEYVIIQGDGEAFANHWYP